MTHEGFVKATWPGSGASLVAQLVSSLPTVQETQVQSLVWEVPRGSKWQPTPIFLPGKT